MNLIKRFKDNLGASALEAVLVFPAFMIALLVVVQFALWEQANHVVQVAAQQGEQAAASFGSSLNSGVDTANGVLNQDADHLLINHDVTISNQPGGQVLIRVSGTALSIIPLFSPAVSAISMGPVQEFRTSG